jgi:ParB family transcriptional regulator, chromosome partitioning protein
MSKNKIEKLIVEQIKSDETTELLELEEHSQPALPGTKRMKSAKWILIDHIHPDLSQPRKYFDDVSVKELSESIHKYGVRQPIVVELDNGFYRIVSGERRYRASKRIGRKDMPCIVQENADPALRFAQQLVENIHREDLSPIDKARAIINYKELLGKDVPWGVVEKKLNISESRRKQFVSLLNLPDSIQREIVSIGKRPSKNQVTEKHARALLLLNDLPAKQVELFDRIKNGTSLSGDESINLAKKMRGKKTTLVLRIPYQSEEELIKKLKQALSDLKKKMKT